MICFFLLLPKSVISQGDSVEKRLYSGELLAKAREILKEYTFKDEKIGEAFKNSEVVAILLEVVRNNDVREIRVSVNIRGEKRLRPLKTLNDNNDPDFKALKSLIEKL
jgi:hypothetical protein